MVLDREGRISDATDREAVRGGVCGKVGAVGPKMVEQGSELALTLFSLRGTVRRFFGQSKRDPISSSQGSGHPGPSLTGVNVDLATALSRFSLSSAVDRSFSTRLSPMTQLTCLFHASFSALNLALDSSSVTPGWRRLWAASISRAVANMSNVVGLAAW